MALESLDTEKIKKRGEERRGEKRREENRKSNAQVRYIFFLDPSRLPLKGSI